MTEQTLRSVQQIIAGAINGLYGEEEATAISYHLLEDMLGVGRAEIQSGTKLISSNEYDILQQAIQRLTDHEPLQYITGKAHFYGLELKVNKHVLIPRPETEELVELMLQSATPSMVVLDIGTGSGCIPVALKKNLPASTVYALDVSTEALAVAKTNAALNGTEVLFIQGDILNEGESKLFPTNLDMIVSNPPYITGSEKKEMFANVLNHEPHLALFVPDDEPLQFYKAITVFAGSHLKKGGALYFEINAAYGNEVKTCMEQYGFMGVQVIKDMQGKDRMVKGILA